MWQELRDYWLPLMLFIGSLLVGAVLIGTVIALPYVIDYLPIDHEMFDLFAEDVVVRRSSIAGAIGLIVTAFVFFRPNRSVLTRKESTRKPPTDTMAGA